jgi:hypothetical protein
LNNLNTINNDNINNIIEYSRSLNITFSGMNMTLFQMINLLQLAHNINLKLSISGKYTFMTKDIVFSLIVYYSARGLLDNREKSTLQRLCDIVNLSEPPENNLESLVSPLYIDEEGGVIGIITESGMEYDVERDIWENMRYTFNEKEQKIEEELLGTYTQFPIRLAWAITVHKSQGLTFQQVSIDFGGGGAFAGGQTYVALSRCTSLEGITLKEPLRQSDIFVRAEVVRFANQYNDQKLINQALQEGKADREYRDAIRAFDKGDFGAFLDNFFKAIHSRYDIEKPHIKRYIRKKLEIINRQRRAIIEIQARKDEEISKLRAELDAKNEQLKRLAAEYTILGRECEHEHMNDAAIRNYQKALELYPDAGDAKRRLKKLQKQ